MPFSNHQNGIRFFSKIDNTLKLCYNHLIFMKNIKNYNNNIILAEEDGQELIVLGKGVGFNLKPGSEVNRNLIEKIFVPQETKGLLRFKDILPELPYENILLAAKIVDYAKEKLKTTLNQSIIIALADHIAFVRKRLSDHLEIKSPLNWDIKHIYPEEYGVSRAALDIMRSETGVAFPEGEAVSIALHFINAESDLPDMNRTMKAGSIIQQCATLVEEHCGRSFSENSSDFIGFITQLRNIIMRFLHPQRLKEASEDEKLFDLLQKQYAFEFQAAQKIADFLEKGYGWLLNKNDLCFLTLYISRLKTL